MDQHTAYGTQHAAHAHAVDTVDLQSVPTAPFEQSDQSEEAVCWWPQHCLQAGTSAQLQACRDANVMVHTFRVQQSLSAGELSCEVLVALGPLLFDSDRSPVDSSGGASDGSLPGLADDDTSSEDGGSVSSDVSDIEDVEVAMPSEHAMALSTLCGDGVPAAVRYIGIRYCG